MFERLTKKILKLSFLFFIIAISLFIYFVFLRSSPIESLRINLKGPNEVLPLETYDYQIEIINNSNKKLTDASIKIVLSSGTFMEDNIQKKEISLFLGDIEEKQTIKGLKLFFINPGDMKENIKAILNYKIKKEGQVFAKEENFDVLVKYPPIKAQIQLPTKVYVNKEFSATFHLINLTKKKLTNIRVSIDVPSGYLLTSSLPIKDKDFYWQFESLDAGETKTISLIGQIQDPKSLGIFSVKTDFSFQNFTYSLTKEIAKVNVLESPVVFYLKSIPESQNINIGSVLFYEVTLENRSHTSLDDGEIRIKLSGNFDFKSLRTDGFFDEFTNTIYFNARNKKELLSLAPGDKVKVEFSISLFRSYPILGESDKNFSVKVRAEYRTKSIPMEIEEGLNEYVVFQEDEKKIIGDIEVGSKLVYKDPVFASQGSFPLQPNQPTTLTWHIIIKSIGEDFENFTLLTRFPFGVNFTGKVGGDAILDNLKYDPKTGAFVYNLNKIPANVGYTQKEIDLAFQLIVEMPANVEGYFVIIPETKISANGSFSGAAIRKTIGEITSSDVLYQ